MVIEHTGALLRAPTYIRRTIPAVALTVTMKTLGFLPRKLLSLPVAWREAECAMLRADAADICGGARVSEDIFDAEEERAEVDIIARAIHGRN